MRDVGADIVTVSPWGGLSPLDCFFEQVEGVFIWCRSPSSDGPQTFSVGITDSAYKRTIRLANNRWRKESGFGLMVDATDIPALIVARRIVGDAVPIFVSGFTRCGSVLENAVSAVTGRRQSCFILDDSEYSAFEDLPDVEKVRQDIIDLKSFVSSILEDF